MPALSAPLEEVHRSILNEIYFKITKDLMKALGIPENSITVLINGLEVGATDLKINSSGLEKDNLPTTSSDRRVMATVSEEYNEDSVYSTAVTYSDSQAIFSDPDIDTVVFPVYVKSDVTINFEYNSPSKTEALRIRDDVRIKLSQMRNILHHEVEYNIILPEWVDDLISDVHELKSRLFPQPLKDYFMSHCTDRVFMMTDMANASNARIAVRERQVRVVGVFDINALPEKIEADRETNTYRFTLPYKFSIEVPRGMSVQYPSMVCNRPLPSKWLDFIRERKIKTKEEYSRKLTYSYSMEALSHFEVHRQLDYVLQNKLPLNLPLWDEFPVRSGHPGYVVLSSFLTDVNEQDKRTLSPLTELDENFSIDKELLQFIRDGERQWIVNPYMSYFYLGLHYRRKHFDNNILEIGSDLSVKSKVDLPLVKPTRITLSLCLDTTSLDPSVIKRMYNHKSIYLLYLSELIRGIHNYRHEYGHMSVISHTFYRNFILMLVDGLKKNEHEFLQRFIDIITQDKLVSNQLFSIIHNNHPVTYAALKRVTDIEKYRVNPHYRKNFIAESHYNARTVMTSIIQASSVKNMQLP